MGAEGVVEHRHAKAKHDDDPQQADGHIVGDAGHPAHPVDRKAAIGQYGKSADDQDGGGRPGDLRQQRVGRLVDADRLRPGLGDEESQSVSADRHQCPVVEERSADQQQRALVQLGRTAGPAEAVEAVTPDMAQDEDR